MTTDRMNSAEVFISENQNWLQRFLTGKTGCRHDAQDLSQDTFIRAITSSVSLLELQEPRAYLATIANRLIFDKARRKKIEQAYLDTCSSLAEDHLLVPSSEEILENIRKLESLVVLLESLPEKPRRAFLMARLDGLGYREIASELNVSVSMVKKYIAKALLHCYDVIEDGLDY